ncbi:MAG: DUF6011 domain-containing protein [Streptosporangiaceae bacterium]
MSTTTTVGAKPPRDSMWRWIKYDGQRLEEIGIKADGSLRNPNGYPEAVVRAAVAEAQARRHARSREAAKKAAATRKRRKERLYYDTARRVIAGKVFGPSNSCLLCGRGFSDPEAIARGIGPECWVPLAKLCNAIRARGDADGLDWMTVVRGILG